MENILERTNSLLDLCKFAEYVIFNLNRSGLKKYIYSWWTIHHQTEQQPVCMYTTQHVMCL